ncbi:hypothetical protein, partial [Vibrio parahaemolyticus]|uniref:hypothetical protein n=1 Tax=Vibrio parahaemolyticus TaxID=670 RepID=UPI0030CE303D
NHRAIPETNNVPIADNHEAKLLTHSHVLHVSIKIHSFNTHNALLRGEQRNTKAAACRLKH